jgi:hypothetical protein
MDGGLTFCLHCALVVAMLQYFLSTSDMFLFPLVDDLFQIERLYVGPWLSFRSAKTLLCATIIRKAAGNT